MAGQSITFDFLTRGADSTASGFRKVGDNTVLAARGARVLADAIEKLGKKENRTSAESKILASALRQTGVAADRTTARIVVADAAIRRLDDAMKDSTKSSGQLGKALGGLKLNPGLVGPLLALAPAIATLGGVGAGAAAGLGGAFIAGGGALAAFGAVAKPVLTDAKKAAGAVEKAQNAYNVAIANGVPQARAFKAEQLAIAKAYAGMSPAQIALSKQLGDMGSAWDKVKAAQTPVVAGALQPWLKSVTGLTSALGPIIAKIAPVIKDLGGQFNSLVGSAAFRGFRDFIGSTGAAAVSAGGSTIIDLVKSFMILLPKFDPLIREAIGWISRLGPAVLKWSESKKAADDITRFMQWFSRNGPVVGGFLKSIGAALAALAPGLASGGALELKVITDFLNFVAKLPPSIAKPLAEVAGAALILSKMGGGKVISFLVTGTLGGIFGKKGGASAGTVAESALAGAGAKGLIGKLLGGGAKLVGAAFVVDVLLNFIPSGPANPKDKAPFGLPQAFETPFGMPGPKDKASANNWLTSWSPYIRQFKTNITDMTGFVSGSWSKFTGFLSGSWGKTWSQITGRSAQGSKSVGDSLAAAGRSADSLRTRNLVPLQGEFGKVTGGIQGLAGTIQGTMLNALRAAGARSDAIRTQNLVPLRGELGKVTGGVQGLQAQIDRLHGKTVNVGVHGSGSGGVQITPSSGVPGAKNYSVFFKPAALGGMIGGGRPGRDSVPAMLMPGEVVVPAGMVRAGAVDHLRGRLPGFASGGLISGGSLAGAQDAVARFGRADAAAEAQVDVSALVKAIKASIAARAAQPSPFAGISGVPSGGPIGAGAAAAQAFAKSILWAYGWGQNQFPPLQALWNGESGWRWNALNPSSGAYGIPQSLPASKMASAGADWRTNPATQIRWGLGYIKAAYGSPANTYARWLARSPHWYGKGGLVPGFASGGQVGTQGAAYLKAWKSRHGGGFGAAWGPVAVNEQIAAMAAAQHRAAVLAGASGLTPGQHRFWAAAAADEKKRLGVLVHERDTERSWRSMLGAGDATLAAEIAAAGKVPGLAGPVKGWKAQMARQKRTIAGISAMLGYSDAQQAAIAKAHPPAKPPAPTGVLAAHTYGGDVADNLGTVLAAALGPFTGAARGGLVSYDRGGWLKPGATMAWNGTSRPEQVIPASGGGGRLQIEWVGGNGGDDLERWIRKNVRVRGGTGPGAVERAYGSR